MLAISAMEIQFLKPLQYLNFSTFDYLLMTELQPKGWNGSLALANFPYATGAERVDITYTPRPFELIRCLWITRVDRGLL